VTVLAELERLIAQKAPFREYAYLIPEFDPLHGNPRFEALLRQIGLDTGRRRERLILRIRRLAAHSRSCVFRRRAQLRSRNPFGS